MVATGIKELSSTALVAEVYWGYVGTNAAAQDHVARPEEGCLGQQEVGVGPEMRGF